MREEGEGRTHYPRGETPSARSRLLGGSTVSHVSSRSPITIIITNSLHCKIPVPTLELQNIKKSVPNHLPPCAYRTDRVVHEGRGARAVGGGAHLALARPIHVVGMLAEELVTKFLRLREERAKISAEIKDQIIVSSVFSPILTSPRAINLPHESQSVYPPRTLFRDQRSTLSNELPL